MIERSFVLEKAVSLERLNAIFQRAFSDNPHESALALDMLRRQLGTHGLSVGDLQVSLKETSHAERLMEVVRNQQKTIEKLRAFKLGVLSDRRATKRVARATLLGQEQGVVAPEALAELLHALAPEPKGRAKIVAELLQVSPHTASRLLKKGFSKTQVACLQAATIRDHQRQEA